MPTRFSREGGAWYIDAAATDLTYTIYYYGVLTPIEDVTSTTYAVTVANYQSNRLTRGGSGTGLFFPTGTTTAQADANYATLTPTLASTVANTQEYKYTGNAFVHWLINNAPEVIIYYAAAEAARYYDVSDGSLENWEGMARERVNEIIREFQRLDSSGTTPQMSRPSLYR